MDYELYHHGIKGQKWGIRRFQPYPKGEKPKGGKEIGEAKKNINDSERPFLNPFSVAKEVFRIHETEPSFIKYLLDTQLGRVSIEDMDRGKAFAEQNYSKVKQMMLNDAQRYGREIRILKEGLKKDTISRLVKNDVDHDLNEFKILFNKKKRNDIFKTGGKTVEKNPQRSR